ncbi:Chondroitin sulfate ABC exolyase [Pontiella desulfatans]|uniref:Chondroitin sulfate ABC exolyase n=1 Tax=Pontiella desulfatans TaxID=2750659 RepID=A0A6C2U2D2_PONDE|nr:chondroitinase family polysaccharide lyase [Pontiella desulfatans]VGO14063.1 Chondroitin sulfate ABC exolyase [Pontiella desulfatans]
MEHGRIQAVDEVMKWICIVLLMAAVPCYAERLMAGTSFEEKSVLEHVSGEGFELDGSRSQFGSTSLKWSGSTLAFSKIRPLSPEESGAAFGSHFSLSPTFVMSIYNDSPVDEKLRVEFNGTTHFELHLNFQGWRTVWVPFSEMDGMLDTLESARMIAPPSAGPLWIDDIIFSQYIDDRHPYPGFEVPFIKEGGLRAWDHWIPEIGAFEQLVSMEVEPVTAGILADLETVEARLRAAYETTDLTPAGAEDYRTSMLFDLPLKMGMQVSPIRYIDAEYNDLRDFGQWMLKVAREYGATGETELEQLFADGARYYLDQGWGAGSSQGTIHHIGYSTRELQTSFFLMKNVLREKGLLDAIGDAVRWQLNFAEMLDAAQHESNLDYYNTQSVYRMMSAFLADDPSWQAACLRLYSDHLTAILAMTNSQGFRPDGTAWHHWGHYPAYATGAFDRIPVSLKALSGTAFRIGESGHANFKRAIMASTVYSNPHYWGLGLSGRHPLGGSIMSLKEAFLALALSGTPDGRQPIDPEVASAYVRLWGNPPGHVFQGVEINTAPPNGHWTFPYAALNVHRRADWSVNIKGYNRYVWASELYGLDNRYGRYQSNGTVQVLPNMSQEAAGYVEDGWDWNHPPGGTTVVLPFEELEPEEPVVMFKSEEIFAGGCTLGGNGIWAMKLNEGDGFTIDPGAEKMAFPNRLQARKSVFCFGGQLLCLGSGIEADGEEPVHTTLFQNGITSTNGAVRHEGEWLVDPIGTGYKILDGAEPVITVGEQVSPNNKYSLRQGIGKTGTKPDAKGLFAKAWLDHGPAPKDASYAYLIVPLFNHQQVFPVLEVLRQDNQAHVVADPETRTAAYACFEKGAVDAGLLESVSDPCHVMIQDGDTLKVAVSNPDLQQLVEAVKHHALHPSPTRFTTLRLKGHWKLESSAEAWTVAEGDSTLLTVKCRDGASIKVELEENHASKRLREAQQNKSTGSRASNPALPELFRNYMEVFYESCS